jgi:hypothetical protein
MGAGRLCPCSVSDEMAECCPGCLSSLELAAAHCCPISAAERASISSMANHLDLLFVLDEYTRDSPSGYVSEGIDVHRIAHDAGLVDWADDERTARWTGELV